MEDKTIVCKDCGKEFIFSVGEQEFYREKGLEHDPVRCPECRRARKAQRTAEVKQPESSKQPECECQTECTEQAA